MKNLRLYSMWDADRLVVGTVSVRRLREGTVDKDGNSNAVVNMFLHSVGGTDVV